MSTENPDNEAIGIPDSENRLGVSPDPQMRAFIRQAAAIIASERGLSDSSRAKLQLLAVKLELPDEMFLTAIEQLKVSSEFSSALTHWEKSFVAFLNNEFKKLNGTVLSVPMENLVLELAQNKYQIPEIRAQHLIQKAADDNGVGRISPTDARMFAHRLIVDSIGAVTVVELDHRDRLYAIGHAWAVKRDVVDFVIQETTFQNRRIAASSKPTARWWLLPLTLSIVAMCSWLVTGKVLWFEKSKANSSGESVTTDVGSSRLTNSNVEPVQTVLPWWSDSIVETVEFASVSDELKIRLSSDDTEVRQRAYRGLCEVRLRQKEMDEDLTRLVVELYLSEPDDAGADVILACLTSVLKVEALTPPLTQRQIERGFAANGILGRIIFQSIDPEANVSRNRQIRARQVAKGIYSFDFRSDSLVNFIMRSQKQLSLDFWDKVQLHPVRSIPITEFLVEQTEQWIEEDVFSQLLLSALAAQIHSKPTQWEMIEKEIKRSIKGASPVQTSQWIDIYGRVENRPLSRRIGQLLLTSIGIVPASDRRSDVALSLGEYRAALHRRKYRPVIVRNNNCERQIRLIEKLIEEQDEESSPQSIARVAYGANLLIALNSEMRGSQFLEFDQLIQKPLPKLSRMRGTLDADANVSDVVPTASELRSKNDAIDKIFNSGASRVSGRISALQSLSRVASRFDDLPYDDAEKLAIYLLREKEIEESLAVEKSLPRFSIWPSLKIALADHVEASKTGIEQLLTMSRLLTGEEISMSDGVLSRAEIRFSLTQNVVKSLRLGNQAQTTENMLSWEKLRVYVNTSNEIRARLIAGPHVALAGSATDQLATALSIRASQDRTQSVRWPQALKRNASVSHEMDRIVGLNFITIEMVVKEIALCSVVAQSQADSVIKDLTSQITNEFESGQRLLLTELALMKLQSILRHERFEEVVGTE